MAVKKKSTKLRPAKALSAGKVITAKRGAEARKALDGSVDAGEFLHKLLGPLTFGSHLRAIRLGEEISLHAFAEKLGVSRQYLCDVEQGRRTVGVARAAEWARLLGYSEPQFVRLALQAELDSAGLELDVTVNNRLGAGGRASKPRASRERNAPAHTHEAE
jgi:transcriptional regulator with XRE-family HTH domain